MEIDFMSITHNSTKRDYLARVNDLEFPKEKAATLAKKWGYDYWDGDRRINYGGYNYIEGRWEKIAKKMIEVYDLKSNSKILDVGCGKGFLLYDFKKIDPTFEVYGLDISKYAIDNAKEEIKKNLVQGNAKSLPFEKIILI
jgi:protein-L-isoaspartate(D-aspartate) O-methyltransferase